MKKSILIIFSSLSIICFNESFAQDNLPFTINSSGGYSSSSGLLYDFNIGEMLLINTFTVGSYHLSQGFLQPQLLNNTSSPSDVFIINNVITPNGDGKNDVFVIGKLDDYPGNRLKIFDRSGRIVYSVTNYKNEWSAMVNGKLLNEDSYYYILDLGKKWALIRGFISVIHDHK